MEPTSLTTEVTLAQYQKPTPVKARIQDTIDFLKSKSIKEKKNMVFQVNNILCKTNY